MKLRAITALLLLATAALMGADDKPNAAPNDGEIAIVGATAIPMTTERVLPDQTIIIRGDRIVAIGPRTTLAPSRGARVIDGRGMFVIPGLADMHVHMSAEDIPLFLANGVTTVRELNGSATTLALRDAIARGERLGPRMIVSGPLIAGEKQRWRHVLVTNADEAKKEVESEIRAGYDEIKVYSGLNRASYDAIAATAIAAGKRFVGHVPEQVGLDAAVLAGQATIEHADTIASAAGHPPDPARIPQLVDLLKTHRTWFTPTLGVLSNLSVAGTPEYEKRLKSVPTDLVDPSLRGWWTSLTKPRNRPRDTAYAQFLNSYVRDAAAAGVLMLFGTDCPNPLAVPGYAIHEETRALREAGLTPYAILRTATVAPAAYLGEAGEFGVLAPGSRADVVILGANPLDDIANLRQVRSIVLRGRFISHEELEAGVAKTREAYKSPS
jgi:imidazolonepropionase-like amidohydrolase